MYLIVFAIVAVAILATIVAGFIAHQKRTRRRHEEAERLLIEKQTAGLVAELVSALERHDENARKRIQSRRYTYESDYLVDGDTCITAHSPLHEIIGRAVKSYDAESDFQSSLNRYAADVMVLKDDTATYADRLAAGRTIISGPRGVWELGQRFFEAVGTTAIEILDLVNECYKAEMQRLLMELRRGAIRYTDFVEFYRQLQGDVRRRDLKYIAWPDDWNELVDANVELPSLNDFKGLRSYGDMPRGQVALMAAEALRQDSSTLGKIVLAYANCRGNQARAEIPDGLLTQVVKMVERKNSEARISPQPNQ